MPKESLEYNRIVLRYYRDPKNTGILKKPDAQAFKLNPLCGDEIKVFLKYKRGRIQEMKYQARGCAITISSASLLSEAIREASLKKLKKMGLPDMEQLLAAKISPARESCATLALEAVKQALSKS